MAEGIRINRYIADSGYCSRREADRLIEGRRVTIDGQVAVLGDKVLPASRVAVDGKIISTGIKKIYIALHKPVGIVSTADPRERMNIVNYINYPERIYPIGRLDKNSSGLILLTNDGSIVNRILRAAGGHEKEYIVRLNRRYDAEFVRRMEAGVPILGTTTLPSTLIPIDDVSFRLILKQGLNRQIRRMCEALGYRVAQLQRVRIMHIRLGSLKAGQWRHLTKEELSELLKAIEEGDADEHSDTFDEA